MNTAPLDAGGFARLDTSDLLSEEEALARESDLCDWCLTEPIGANDYRVVADNRHFSVCPLCWGRSAEYVALRQDGLEHKTALRKVTAA